jgi:hypothetical protein
VICGTFAGSAGVLPLLEFECPQDDTSASSVREANNDL